MTDSERALYDRMSPREQRAIDALSPELQSQAIVMWVRINAIPKREPPPGYVPWDQRPRRETLAPPDDSFADPTDERERYP